MKASAILSTAQWFFKIIFITIIVVFIASSLLLCHSFIAPQFYKKVIVKTGTGSPGITYDENVPVPPKTYAEWNAGSNKNIYFSNLSWWSKFSIVKRFFLYLAIVLLILKELINFLGSTKKYSSFFFNNYICFKRIGFYLIVWMIYSLITDLTGFNLKQIYSDGVVINNFKIINFSGYIFHSALIILSVVIGLLFKEGERLRIENQLTI